ncbi:MAG: YcgN family cysteine cluster protein [Thioalkalivibrionaceae bacterium]
MNHDTLSKKGHTRPGPCHTATQNGSSARPDADLPNDKNPTSSPDTASTSGLRPRFWEAPLDSYSEAEWEALCDGCGRCCLHKYEDEDSGRIVWSCVACHLLDTKTGRCGDYEHRRRQVPDCLAVDLALVQNVSWLPPTCAYRLRAEDRPLPEWHPLLTGDPESVRRAGVSVAGRAISELEALDVPAVHYVVAWPGQWPQDEKHHEYGE